MYLSLKKQIEFIFKNSNSTTLLGTKKFFFKLNFNTL